MTMFKSKCSGGRLRIIYISALPHFVKDKGLIKLHWLKFCNKQHLRPGIKIRLDQINRIILIAFLFVEKWERNLLQSLFFLSANHSSCVWTFLFLQQRVTRDIVKLCMEQLLKSAIPVHPIHSAHLTRAHLVWDESHAAQMCQLRSIFPCPFVSL